MTAITRIALQTSKLASFFTMHAFYISKIQRISKKFMKLVRFNIKYLAHPYLFSSTDLAAIRIHNE